MNYLIKTATIVLSAVSIFIPLSAVANDLSPSQLPKEQTTEVHWTNVPTQTITANGITFAYRELGKQNGGTPVVFLVHLAAVMDNWDPRVVDGIASNHHVIVFDNKGLGASSGKSAESIEEMADDATTFIKALGFKQVDLLGFSMGGMVAQEIVLN